MHRRALCGKDKKNRLKRKEDRGTLPRIRASHLANIYLESTGIRVPFHFRDDKQIALLTARSSRNCMGDNGALGEQWGPYRVWSRRRGKNSAARKVRISVLAC